MSNRQERRNSNITDQQRTLIQILEKIYRDNLTLINRYTNINNEIRNNLRDILLSTNINSHDDVIRGELLHDVLQDHLSNTSQQTRNTNRTGNVVSRPHRFTSSTLNNASNQTRTYSNGSNSILFRETPQRTSQPIISEVFEFTIPFPTSSTNSSEPLNDLFSNFSGITGTINMNNIDNNNPVQSELLRLFVEPIQVCPTLAEIDSATRNIKFNDITDPQNTKCPICLEEFTENDTVTIIRHCKNIFKPTELSYWLRSHCICPVCRYDIRNSSINLSNSI